MKKLLNFINTLKQKSIKTFKKLNCSNYKNWAKLFIEKNNESKIEKS